MSRRELSYFLPFSLPILTFIAFTSSGWLTFLPVMEAFVLIPLLELFIRPDRSNPKPEQEASLTTNRFYDWLLYLLVPIHWFLLIYFLFSIHEVENDALSLMGRTLSMGLMCGSIGINVAHELGHRFTKYEQFMARALLLSSLYMHFFLTSAN